MAGAMTAYSFKNVVVAIDGKPARGFWEGDDAVMIERNQDNVTPIVGADGDATVSISADDSVKITLKLQPNSPTNELLNSKFLQNRSGRLRPFRVSIRDTANGEGGASAQCVVQQSPSASYGANAGSRDWVLFASPWTWGKVDYES